MEQTAITVVPCAPHTRKACELVREALARLEQNGAGIEVLESDAPQLPQRAEIIAVDSGRECKATARLDERGIRHTAFYLPDIVAQRHLLEAGRPLSEQWERLVQGIEAALTDKIAKLRREIEERERYFAAMRLIAKRYLREVRAVEGIGAPKEESPNPPAAARERLALAANRFRNQFMRCDQIVPPEAFSVMHDVFQDACMCMTYAIQHWERGEWEKAREYLEQASHQAGPLVRRQEMAGVGDEEN